MLNCRACLWRCFRALDASHTSLRSLRSDVAPSLLFAGQTRSLRTRTEVVPQIGRPPRELTEVEKLERAKDTPWHNSTQAASLKKQERKSLTLQPPSTPAHRQSDLSMQKFGRRDPHMSGSDWTRRKRELQHLADPLELADFVKQELGKGKVDEMLQLVRMASHSMQCIVSWNHVIDHYLAKGRVSHAIKVYNDMKKRAQFPDSYTYTIILRGLATNANETGALAKALAIYHSMSAPNSRVQPSIIHTNAILKVCARCADMDALWGIVAKIPEKGPTAANGITYVTILNAIRQALLIKPPLGETPEELAMRRDRDVVEGRRIWEEIVRKWRQADLVVEEELVCSMGRLLLVGTRPRDWDDVLSLVEQTMDIPRLVPRLGTPARYEAGYPHIRAPNVPEQFRYDDDNLSPEKGVSIRGEEFAPVAAEGEGVVASSALRYATPSNNTLSLLLEACQKVVAAKAGKQYWDTLTDPATYNITPDRDNLNFLLRLLRQNRSSAQMVELLQSDWVRHLDLRPGTFRIAMSTCTRDKNNHNSLRHAGQILDLMSRTFEDADPGTVERFAELARSHPLARGPELLEAVERLKPITDNLRIQLSVGSAWRDAKFGAKVLSDDQRVAAIQALRAIAALHHKLIDGDLISEEEKRPLKAARAKMSSYMNRVRFKDERRKTRREADEPEGGDGTGVNEEVEAGYEFLQGGDSGRPREKRTWRQRQRHVVGGERRKPWFSPGQYSEA